MCECSVFPVIDLPGTGRNIRRLRERAGVTVRELQAYFGFEYPQAIYKWQHGECLPSVDNLLALARVLQVPMEDLLVYDDREVSYFWRRAGMTWQSHAWGRLRMLRTTAPSKGDRRQAVPPSNQGRSTGLVVVHRTDLPHDPGRGADLGEYRVDALVGHRRLVQRALGHAGGVHALHLAPEFRHRQGALGR